MMTEDIRNSVIQILDSLDGLSCSNPDQRQDWLDLLGQPPTGSSWDLDKPFKCWQDTTGHWHTQGISTCALVALGIWRKIGVDADELYTPYKNGAAVSEVVAIAKRMGGWKSATCGETPNPGDVIVLSSPHEHVLTVYDFSDELNLISIDGGQTDINGLQAIKRCSREWSKKSYALMLGKSTIYGWADISTFTLKVD